MNREKAVLLLRIPLGVSLAIAFFGGAGVCLDILALLHRV